MRYGKVISQIGPLIMLGAGLAPAFGAVAALDLGSFRRMGPGAYPLLVGGLLAVIGLQHCRGMLADPSRRCKHRLSATGK